MSDADSDGSDALVRVPSADADAGATDFGFDDDAVVTVYTFNGETWQPMRLEHGDATTVRLPNGQPAAKIVVDPDEDAADEKISSR